MRGRAVIHAAGITGKHALTVTLSPARARAHMESTRNLISANLHHFGNEGWLSLWESPTARINYD